MDADFISFLFLLSLDFFQEGVVLGQCVLGRSGVRLLGRKGDEEWILKSVEVAGVRVQVSVGVLLLDLVL